MKDCADSARVELTVALSSVLPEIQRIYRKTRPDHRGQVLMELNRLCDQIVKSVAKG